MYQEAFAFLKRYCRPDNFKPTNTRIVVLSILLSEKDWSNPEGIWLKMRSEEDLSVSYSTVYLALKWLDKQGFLKKEIRDNRTVYSVHESMVKDILKKTIKR